MAWNNRTDAGTLSGGSWLATLPLANLQNRQVQKVARSADAALASTQFVIDLDSPRGIGVIALIVHNISEAGKIKITGSADNFSAIAYDSGWLDVWPAGIVPMGLLEWEDDNFWLGTLSPEQRAGYQAPFIHVLNTAQSLRYWKIEIDDTWNSAGYVHIGRLFMALGWRPDYNMLYGATLGYDDPTEIVTSLTGAEYFDVRGKYRLHKFKLGVLSKSEAYDYVMELQRLAGTSGEVLIVPQVTGDDQFVKRSFVGRLTSMSPVQHDHPTIYATDMTIKELL